MSKLIVVPQRLNIISILNISAVMDLFLRHRCIHIHTSYDINIYIYIEREREITLYDIIEHFYNTRIIQIFATHFPGMKNQRGGSYFSFHGKHAVLFFQVEGWPH